MKKKLKIDHLEVQSFVTSADREKKVKAGTGFTRFVGCQTLTNCPTCPCSEAYTICCPPTEDFNCPPLTG